MGKPYHKIEVEGKTYRLRLNSWAVRTLDKDHNFRFSKMGSENMDIPEVILILYASLFEYHEDIANLPREGGLKFASKALDELGLEKGIKLIVELMFDYYPRAKTALDGSAELKEEAEGNAEGEFTNPTGMNS
jgi:hypothetical protein